MMDVGGWWLVVGTCHLSREAESEQSVVYCGWFNDLTIRRFSCGSAALSLSWFTYLAVWRLLFNWMLVVGCWMLVVGCWLLDVGCWLLDVGCSVLFPFRVFRTAILKSFAFL